MFKATHVISTQTEEIPVMLVDSSAYTKSEYVNCKLATWESLPEGWFCNGEIVGCLVREIKVEVLECNDEEALFCHYHGQSDYQRPIFVLDPGNRTLHAGFRGDIGGAVPVHEYHKRTLSFSTDLLTGSAANDLMYSESVQKLANMICDGFELSWDGHNHVGNYNMTADVAMEQLNDIFSEANGQHLEVWDAEDWIQNCRNQLLREVNEGKYADVDALQKAIEDGEAQDGNYLLIKHADKAAQRLWEEAHKLEEEEEEEEDECYPDDDREDFHSDG